MAATKQVTPNARKAVALAVMFEDGTFEQVELDCRLDEVNFAHERTPSVLAHCIARTITKRLEALDAHEGRVTR